MTTTTVLDAQLPTPVAPVVLEDTGVSADLVAQLLLKTLSFAGELRGTSEQFADIRILRYQVPEFDSLSLNQKKLLYYLSQAAIAGRDIIYAQNGKYNLLIRQTLENIVESYSGNRANPDFEKLMVYTKRVWFSNGIYHHYSSDKFIPEFSKEFFTEVVKNSDELKMPLEEGQSLNDLLGIIIPVMFDPSVLPKKVSHDPNSDMVQSSAVTFYEGVTQKEAEKFYDAKKKPNDEKPLSYGINTRLVKQNGKITEIVYKEDGLYGEAIREIVKWLEKAIAVAENDLQKDHIQKLISYYKTGDLVTWDEYNVAWVKDTLSQVDFVNGFIETYKDPLSIKATWEAVINFKDIKATRRTEIISNNAQWFEDNSPVDPRFKKKQVKGVSAKVITAVQLGGDNSPSTAIGINLPNADWIRKEHGSKSVTLENITYAYDRAAQGNGFLEEFSFDQSEIDLMNQYGFVTDNLHTDLHECLGHGSGQLLPGVSSEALKNYQSVLEETRADLFALYYLADQKMVDLGLVPSKEAAKAEYLKYIRNGLMTQLTRIEPGKNIEQAHMRNRQLISKWCFEKGANENVIENVTRNGKTYFRINDYEKLRALFADLLREVQRIKSEGDLNEGKKLVETYGVKVDPELHKEVKERYSKLNLAPYNGFINPELVADEEDGEITDVKVVYPNDFTEQMMKYSREFSFLPVYN
jgi:dipeptidyl-peptidase-3